MPLKRKHLDGLKLASFDFKEEFLHCEVPIFIAVSKDNIVEMIEFLENNFVEDKPYIPVQMIGSNEYWFYINKNE